MTTNPDSTAGQLRITLAHRFPLVHELMSSRLQAAGFEIAGQANSVRLLRQLLARQTPDVVLLDWELPDREEETLKTLVQEVSGRPIVIISPPQPPEVIIGALQSGVRGCLSYNLSSEDFTDRLRLLARGDLFISGDLSSGLEEQLAASDPVDTQDGLSDREREVLSLVAYGSTNREIAEKLIVTENTVKVHLRHILEKLDLRNRQQAAAYAVRSGLVESEEPQDAEQS